MKLHMNEAPGTRLWVNGFERLCAGVGEGVGAGLE